MSKKRQPGIALLYAAGLIALGFVVLHALGGREGTSVLSGTTPLDGDGLLGVLYAGAYLLLVVLAPILTLAWLVRVGLERVWPEPTGSGSSPSDA
jgi:hypothetical protein